MSTLSSPRLALALGPMLFGALLMQCNDPSSAGTPCSSDRDCTSAQRCGPAMVCVSRSSLDSGLLDALAGDGRSDSSSPRPDTGPRDTGPGLQVTGVVIDPPSATITSTNGAQTTQNFTATFVWNNGTMAPASGGIWSLSASALGDIDESTGIFTANGLVGGQVTVSVRVANPLGGEPLTATALLTVALSRSIIPAGVPAETVTHFGTLVPDAMAGTHGAGLAYPLDGVVFPQNVYPADVQWLNGAAGDEFRITFAKPHATVTAYLVHTGASFGNHYLVDQAAWRAFSQTDGDTAATLTVDRYTGGMAYAGAPVTLRFARAAVTGSVYYWDIAAGRIVRIDDGTATRNEIMPAPPLDSTGTSQCVGCHSVSPNGRFMAGRLGGGENIGGVFDLTADLTGNPPPTQYPLRRDPAMVNTSARWWFSSWAPDSSRLALSTDEGATRVLRILDPMSGAYVTTMGTALPDNVTHPAWAPDNSAIAVVGNLDAWGGDNSRGDVGIVPRTGPDTFGPLRYLHMGASLSGRPETGVADAYPTWEPDSARIVFAHGTGSRSDTGSVPLRRSALYAMNSDGANVTRLDNASGAGFDNFQPRFAPFQNSGYVWLSFLSRRDYGNATVGTRGTQVQQIWVSAIRLPAPGDTPGADPSAVPYWLPGQNPRSRNIAAFWAPRPCRTSGEGCSVGSECCSGDCYPPATGGAAVCSPPRMMRCRMLNETCDTTADCCTGTGATCIDHVCANNPG